ncbi:glycosyltransferase family 4 protein [Bacillus sp. DJP31]|uniref:glycosyltransferase family 4 protein n=1 Tax=Bacillus sp. DJP31 TaxID=3409789 RepID=UPI003BB71138
MKILYVTTISNTVNAFLIPHIKFLIEQGNEVNLACNIVQEVNQELFQLGCNIHQVEFQRSPLKRENVTAYKKIKDIVLHERYEMVHVHTPVASFITRLACRNIKNVKVFYTAHGFHFYKGAPKVNWFLYYTLEKLAARWTDTVITMNDEDYKAAQNIKFRSENSVFKVHGVGLDFHTFLPQTKEKKERLRAEYGYDQSDFILIYVGELSYRKHQDLLIEAISHLKDEILQIRLLLVGDGEKLPEYKELVMTLGLENKVEFLGYRKDVHHLMTIADVAISTSRQEGLPVNVMEAMATGLPVVVTDCRGNRDLVNNGENGFIVGVDDLVVLANGIEKLYLSNDLRQVFAERNVQKVQKFALKQVLLEMKEVYEKQSIKLKSS